MAPVDGKQHLAPREAIEAEIAGAPSGEIMSLPDRTGSSSRRHQPGTAGAASPGPSPVLQPEAAPAGLSAQGWHAGQVW